ncbi:hypothetical protein [Actinoplanes rectilineatus]|uniref:hypothetical protein n=1 Tax=Actinoplanes rectilineatus TaxID=113571 RepID=UPI0005F298F6|nr:hypothetical protein [Actinoplanes rectilineatus]
MVLLAPFLTVFDYFAMSTVAPLVWQHPELILAVFSTVYAAGLVTGGVLATARAFPPPSSPSSSLDPAGLTLGVLLPLSVLGPLTLVRLTDVTPLFLLFALTVVPLGVAYRRRARRVFANRTALVAAVGTGAAYAGQAAVLLLAAPRPEAVGYGIAFAVFSLLRRPIPQAAVAVLALTLLAVAGYSGIPLVLCGAAMGAILPRLTARALSGAVPGAASGALATVQQFAAAAAVTLTGWLR